jgi:hypothetical protein
LCRNEKISNHGIKKNSSTLIQFDSPAWNSQTQLLKYGIPTRHDIIQEIEPTRSLQPDEITFFLHAITTHIPQLLDLVQSCNTPEILSNFGQAVSVGPRLFTNLATSPNVRKLVVLSELTENTAISLRVLCLLLPQLLLGSFCLLCFRGFGT